jgi:hypothetical protein
MKRLLQALLSLLAFSALLGAGPGLVAEAAATPYAESAPGTTKEGTPVELTLSGGSNLDVVLSFSIVTGPTHGTLGPIGAQNCAPSGTGVNCVAHVTYTPSSGFFGFDDFTYAVDDGTGTANGAGSIDVRPAPNLPGATFLSLGNIYSETASNLIPGATVDWGDGSPEAALTVEPDGTAALTHTYATEGTFSIEVTNHNGPFDDTSTTLVFTTLPGASNSTFGVVEPGATGTLSIPGALDATLTHGLTGTTPAILFLALYGNSSGLPGPVDPSVPLGLVVASALYDVRVTDAGGDDLLTVRYALPPGTELATLLFFNPVTSTFVPVKGSTLVPNSYVVDAAAHTVTVIFDQTSFPTLAQLGGTRFAVLGKREAPRIDGLRVHPRCSTSSGRGGPSLRLSLSQAASVEVSVQRRKGSRDRTRCQRHNHRRGQGKPRFERPQRISHDLPAGSSTISRRLRLGPGSYRVTVSASNLNGVSAPVRSSFVVR